MANGSCEDEDQRGGIIAFRATPQLIERIDASAAAEGITRASVARRAVIRDLGPAPARSGAGQ